MLPNVHLFLSKSKCFSEYVIIIFRFVISKFRKFANSLNLSGKLAFCAFFVFCFFLFVCMWFVPSGRVRRFQSSFLAGSIFGVRTALIAGEANSEAFKPAQIFFSSFSFFTVVSGQHYRWSCVKLLVGFLPKHLGVGVISSATFAADHILYNHKCTFSDSSCHMEAGYTRLN